mgnify:CR=1 FL=1
MIHTYGNKKVTIEVKLEEKKVAYSLEGLEKQFQCDCCGKSRIGWVCNECNDYFYEQQMIVEIEKTLSEASMDIVDPSEPY